MDFSKAFASTAFLYTVVSCAADPAATEADSAGSSSQAGGSTTNNSGGSGVGVAGSTASLAGSSATAGGTTSGGSGTGGSAGSPPTTGTCAAVDMAGLISDFETGKAEVTATAGRGGSWFLYSDGTGMQTPIKVVNTPLAAEAGGACGSAYAFHTTGTGFTTWGAGLGTDFAPKTAMARAPYDLSPYSGIAFRAKAAATTPLRVSISDTNTAPEGAKCVDTTDATNVARCGDYFGSEVTLSPEFKDFVIKFSDMKQRGFGLPIATGLEKTKAFTVRMQVKGTAQAPAIFDLWLDDVRLVP